MAPAAKSNGEKRSAENREGIKHFLEDVWDFDSDETFYNIFSKESKKGVQDVIGMNK